MEAMDRLLSTTAEPDLRQLCGLMVRPAFELARERSDCGRCWTGNSGRVQPVASSDAGRACPTPTVGARHASPAHVRHRIVEPEHQRGLWRHPRKRVSPKPRPEIM